MFRLTVKSGRSIIRLPCGTKFLRVLMFAIFSAIRKNRFRQENNNNNKIIITIIIINTVNIFPAKIYFRVNILELKFATQKYSTNKEVVSVRFCNRMTKKSNLFYSFYTGYAKHSVVLKYVFPLQILKKKKKNGRKYYQWFFRHFLSFFCKKSVPSKKNQSVLNAK